MVLFHMWKWCKTLPISKLLMLTKQLGTHLIQFGRFFIHPFFLLEVVPMVFFRYVLRTMYLQKKNHYIKRHFNIAKWISVIWMRAINVNIIYYSWFECKAVMLSCLLFIGFSNRSNETVICWKFSSESSQRDKHCSPWFDANSNIIVSK